MKIVVLTPETSGEKAQAGLLQGNVLGNMAQHGP